MPQIFTPKVVTANALIEGDVIYLAEDDSWTRDLACAEVLSDEAHAQLRLLDAARRTAEAVGVYLADVRPGPRGPEPAHFREDFRRKGPSNHFHGKQANEAAKNL
ncbi:DUF2849 domain-containing protein [Aestuariicoccus sp. MJ-SS9]|uniref:DUF2849 domain-containing protein n=1 Tax=Aestuariicoccus sp. MJ-SS9 TaxID=3079855 RepID=UPI002912875F|nr:DUF2849 domain-containing protein [Aestuariicoccus sp. MJ-SS9]MDU8910598.1 DUF2849 domain-containing protein [Aestuariicoccus sp. MJ-SS9]